MNGRISALSCVHFVYPAQPPSQNLRISSRTTGSEESVFGFVMVQSIFAGRSLSGILQYFYLLFNEEDGRCNYSNQFRKDASKDLV
jgi:hypothetical protein